MTDSRSAPPELAPPDFFPPKEIWVLGAGHFGHLAAKRLGSRYPQAGILVVDRQEAKLSRIRGELGVSTALGDALSFLANNPPVDSLWIIPAVTIHLAFQWILAQLSKTERVHHIPVPESMDAMVPNPHRSPYGTLYASFATFLCPDVCNEPDDICTYTREPRQGNLHDLLGQIRIPGFRTTVARSWQLAPGVGGYAAGYLRQVLEEVLEAPGAYLIATSCRCHGVVDALEWTPAHAS